MRAYAHRLRAEHECSDAELFRLGSGWRRTPVISPLKELSFRNPNPPTSTRSCRRYEGKLWDINFPSECAAPLPQPPKLVFSSSWANYQINTCLMSLLLYFVLLVLRKYWLSYSLIYMILFGQGVFNLAAHRFPVLRYIKVKKELQWVFFGFEIVV